MKINDGNKKKNLYPTVKTTPILLSGAKLRFTGNGKVYVDSGRKCDVEILDNDQFHIFKRFRDEKKPKGESILDVDIYIDYGEYKKILELLENNVNSTIEEVKELSLGRIDFKVAYIQSRFLINKWAWESEQYPQNAICQFGILKGELLGFYFKYSGTDKWNKDQDIIEIKLTTKEYRELVSILRTARNKESAGEYVSEKAESMESSDDVLGNKQTDIQNMWENQ